MTVLGPIPDHVARAMRGESQELSNAQREECAADSSACLPPDVRVGANPPYTSIGGREIRGVLAGLADRDKIERVIREQAYAYQQRRIETNYATLGGGLALTHPSSCACYSCWDARRREAQSAKGWTEHVRKQRGSTVEVVAPKDTCFAVVNGLSTQEIVLSAVFHFRNAAEETHHALGLRPPVVELPNTAVDASELPCGLAFHGVTGRHSAETSIGERLAAQLGFMSEPEFCEELARHGCLPDEVEALRRARFGDGHPPGAKWGPEELKAALTRLTGELTTQSRCKDCNGSDVLAGFGFGTSANAVDRPCHCSPPKDEGPSEWTVTDKRCVYRDDLDGFERWEVRVRLGKRSRFFEVRAIDHGTYVEDSGGVEVVQVKGEHCVDMAIARLLCGLRDGSIAL